MIIYRVVPLKYVCSFFDNLTFFLLTQSYHEISFIVLGGAFVGYWNISIHSGPRVLELHFIFQAPPSLATIIFLSFLFS